MIKHAVFAPRIKVNGTALTASFAVIGNFVDDINLLAVFNSCDRPVEISFDGSTVHFEFECEAIVIDLKSLSRQIKAGNIWARHSGVAPSNGSLRISAEIAALRQP